ncbi:High-affinity glucose transporter [Sphaceloma murrayae]|uniref:High-affinity glucose transporter n=1 Tax=Sphaceloma murrayae TaxID=2082308 RepID=A0A2K1QFG5_9PEZI|nr:High-affinity glucose transporter [Sphaceloma murrayae]
MGKYYNFWLACFAGTGSFLFGYDAGVMTNVIASPNFLAYFNTDNTSPIIGAINATFSGGAVFGSLMGGFTMDRLGRNKTIQIGAIIAAVGGILQAATYHLSMMLLGRILSGWAVGLMSMSVPVYQAECAPPKIRGLIVGLTQQMIGVGFIISTWVGYGAHYAPDTSSFQWRFPLAFQVLPSIILVAGLAVLPESPRWLIEKDRDEEARVVLQKLHFDGDNQEWIDREYAEIRATISAERNITAQSWSVMFKVPSWRKRLMLGTLVQVFTQLTGINVIGYYQTVLYESLGFTGGRAVLVAGIYNVVGPIANLIFIFFIIDRVGRRRPLLFGAAGITISLICEAVINQQNPGGTREGVSIAGVFFLFLVSIIFSLSFGPISWVFMSEIMPMQIRGRGIGNWLVSTIFAQVSPIAYGDISWRYYLVFIVWNIVVTIPTIYFIFPETNKLSLEEIDLLFGERALGALPADINEKDIDEVLRIGSVADKDAKVSTVEKA